MTLLTTDEIFGGELDQLLEGLADFDDVFIPEFGGVLVEKVPDNESSSTRDAMMLSRELYRLERSLGIANDMGHLPSGPYILHGPNLYQAWRLYDDEYEAFAFGIIPEDVNVPAQYEPKIYMRGRGPVANLVDFVH